MLPSYYACSGCDERFELAQRRAFYHLKAGTPPRFTSGSQVSDADLLEVPVRPGWCKDCAALCLVEDIASLRAFEDAYGAVRAGRAVEYPLETEYLDRPVALDEAATYLRWRMDRRHPARALCCGRANYQLLDVPQPLLKHAACDFGVVEPCYIIPGPGVGPGPGVYSAANFPVYSSEGQLIGRLTWRERGSSTWDVVPAGYPSASED